MCSCVWLTLLRALSSGFVQVEQVPEFGAFWGLTDVAPHASATATSRSATPLLADP